MEYSVRQCLGFAKVALSMSAEVVLFTTIIIQDPLVIGLKLLE